MARKPSKPSPKTPIDTSATWTLRITPLRAPQVYRTLEFAGGQTLETVHRAIQDVFDLDDDHLYSFFLTNRAWDRKDVVSLSPEHPWERDVATTRLASLDLAVGRKFLYLFDFGDELRHSIEVVAKGRREPAASYPRVIESQGKAPAQYESDEFDDVEDDEEDLAPLAPEHEPLAKSLEEAVNAYERFLDRIEDDELRPIEEVERDVSLAKAVLAILGSAPDQFEALDDRLGVMIEEWMSGIPFDLAEHGRFEDALLLAREIEASTEGVFETTTTLEASILVRAGRPDEARALAEAVLAKDPDGSKALQDAADIFEALGDLDRARPIWQVLVERGEPPYCDSAAYHLGLSDSDDGDAEEQAEQAPVIPLPPAHAVPFVAAGPKPGRNDPCPCGSGKKYKKCCGG